MSPGGARSGRWGVGMGVLAATAAMALTARPATAAAGDLRLQLLGAQLMYLQLQSLVRHSAFPPAALREAAMRLARLQTLAAQDTPRRDRRDRLEALRAAVTTTAQKHLGAPYRWAGTTPQGFDCSGFLQTVFNEYEIGLPRRSRDQAVVGTRVAVAALQPGDLLFFAFRKGHVDHAALYLGEGRIIHASASAGGVVISDLSAYHLKHLVVARRVLDAGTAAARSAEAIIGWEVDAPEASDTSSDERRRRDPSPE